MKKTTLLSALFAVARSLAAQGGPFSKPRMVRGGRLFPAGVVAADVDLDGHRDLVVGNAFSLDTRNGPMSAVLLDASYRVRSTEHLEVTGETGLLARPGTSTATGCRTWSP